MRIRSRKKTECRSHKRSHEFDVTCTFQCLFCFFGDYFDYTLIMFNTSKHLYLCQSVHVGLGVDEHLKHKGVPLLGSCVKSRQLRHGVAVLKNISSELEKLDENYYKAET